MSNTNSTKRKFTQLTQPECRAKIVRYTPRIPRTKVGGMVTIHPKLVGIPAKKPGYIHRLNDCGQASKDMMKIPNNMKKGRVTESIKKRFCDNIPDVKKEKACAKRAVEMWKWIKKTTKKHQLTIRDVLKMKKGQKTKFLVLDRNISDSTYDLPDNKVMAPSTFFKTCWAVYTHDHDMHGTIKYEFQSKNEDPWPFNFEINYKDESWYPLDDTGTLSRGIGRVFGIKKSYKKFDKKTRVGYRGPMISWSKLKDLPKIYKCQFCSSALF